MNFNSISVNRVLDKLDEYFHKNDYNGALKHLLYWLKEAENNKDYKAALLINNELMGLYRKLGKENEALEKAEAAIGLVKLMQIDNTVGAATTYLNSATVYKAFGKAQSGLELFEKAKFIYEKELDKTDSRLAGLYNNMALALVDLNEFKRAHDLYNRALIIMGDNEGSEPEQAITWLNKASALEAEKGIEVSETEIDYCLENARLLLDKVKDSSDGNYAFVCEKCSGVFGYYGYFLYKKELEERAERIYERA